jgi:branched-chain amino acid transport system permease protein
MLARARDNIGWPTVVVLILLGIFPIIVSGPSPQSIMVTAMIYATGAVGLDLLTGYAGQFSFGQFVYFAVGAYTMSALRVHAMLPWPLAMLAGVLVAGLIAGLMGAALVRLKFFGLAVGTFFLGAVAINIIGGDRLQSITGGSNGIASPPAAIGGLDLTTGYGLYYIALAALALAALVVVRYTKTRAGIANRVIKENETVAAVMGIKVFREKIRVQVVGGLVAGLGGCILAFSLGYLSPDSFDVTQSIELFAVVVVGGVGSIVGPILGAIFFFEAVNSFSSSGSVSELFFAIILLAVVIFFNRGIYDLFERLFRWILARRRGGQPSIAEGRAESRGKRTAAVRVAVDAPAAAVPTADAVTGGPGVSAPGAPLLDDTVPASRRAMPSAADPLLQVRDLTVQFGGVKALDGVSLDVRRGEVHAIIGPNGAGKTTFLNCISGIQPADGEVILDGRTLAGESVSSRRGRGLARTFQHPSLVGDLSVLGNVQIGAFASQTGSILAEMLGTSGPRRRRSEADDRAAKALSMVEFPAERWGAIAGDATMGEQKHVDIARAIASQPMLLLLDEPTAGLGAEEVGAVARAIEAVRDSGMTILVIAHHVGFVRQIADRCTVLDFGKVLTSGEPAEVLDDPRVIDIFVGTGERV